MPAKVDAWEKGIYDEAMATFEAQRGITPLDLSHFDEVPKGLVHLGAGALAVTFTNGTQRPITPADIPTYFEGGRGYDGSQDSWGEASLFVHAKELHLAVHSVLAHDGGRDRDLYGRWSSRDGGRTWSSSDRVVPNDATLLGSYSTHPAP